MTLARKTPMNRGTTPMKRTAFGPSKIGLQRTAMKAGTKKLRARKAGPRTDSTFRSAGLLAVVRKLPCMECGRQHRTQAAHSNQLRFGKGRGIKASDAAMMALCSNPAVAVPGCHELHDQGGTRTKIEAWTFEYEMISRTLLALIAARRLVGDAGVLLALPAMGTDWETLCMALVWNVEAGRLTVAPQP